MSLRYTNGLQTKVKKELSVQSSQVLVQSSQACSPIRVRLRLSPSHHWRLDALEPRRGVSLPPPGNAPTLLRHLLT